MSENQTDGGSNIEKKSQTDGDLGEETTSEPPQDKLNMDEILTQPKTSLKSKENGKGMSRREVAELKKEQEGASDERFEEIQERLERIESEREKFEREKEEFYELKQTTEKTALESKVNSQLMERGISPSEFNTKYKDKFIAERDELVES